MGPENLAPVLQPCHCFHLLDPLPLNNIICKVPPSTIKSVFGREVIKASWHISENTLTQLSHYSKVIIMLYICILIGLRPSKSKIKNLKGEYLFKIKNKTIKKKNNLKQLPPTPVPFCGASLEGVGESR